MAKKKKSSGRRGRRGKVNKSQAIRDALKIMGADAAPKDVIARLSKKKIAVSSAHVSNVKATLVGGVGRSRRRGRDVVSVSTLIAAKRLIKQVGGVAEARRALEAIAQLD